MARIRLQEAKDCEDLLVERMKEVKEMSGRNGGMTEAAVDDRGERWQPRDEQNRVSQLLSMSLSIDMLSYGVSRSI
ncbi:MAG: hypothetical protein Q9192_000985 [Flavoplaca navasiana]